MAVDMLIYAVSLDLQLPSRVTIHNQCSKTELVSPVYFRDGAVCPKLSDQRMDIDAKNDASFEIYSTQDNFEGALLYKLQKHIDDQHNIDTSTTEANKNESIYVYMLIVWKWKDSKPFAHIALVEHAEEFTWDENKLRKLYAKNRSRLKEYDNTISDTWSMGDNMALKTSIEVKDLKGYFELSISISEEKDDYAMRPLSIDLER
jgi:hypothetical protein